MPYVEWAAGRAVCAGAAAGGPPTSRPIPSRRRECGIAARGAGWTSRGRVGRHAHRSALARHVGRGASIHAPSRPMQQGRNGPESNSLAGVSTCRLGKDKLERTLACPLHPLEAVPKLPEVLPDTIACPCRTSPSAFRTSPAGWTEHGEARLHCPIASQSESRPSLRACALSSVSVNRPASRRPARLATNVRCRSSGPTPRRAAGLLQGCA